MYQPLKNILKLEIEDKQMFKNDLFSSKVSATREDNRFPGAYISDWSQSSLQPLSGQKIAGISYQFSLMHKMTSGMMPSLLSVNTNIW